MDLKKMNLTEIENIYNNFMLEDFPKSELKSLKTIVRLYKLNKYFAFGIYEKDEFLGYALTMTSENIVLLDYFAIKKDDRNKGYGGLALNLITNYFEENFDVFILECENPKFYSNEMDKEKKQGRINFYLKNGFVKTSIEANVFTNEYIVLSKNNKTISDKEIAKAFFKIYVAMSNEEISRKNVFINLN